METNLQTNLQLRIQELDKLILNALNDNSVQSAIIWSQLVKERSQLKSL